MPFQAPAFMNETPKRSEPEALLVCAGQLVPPLLVAMIVPTLPTAQACIVSPAATALRGWVVPLGLLAQVTPALLVFRMLPVFPTAHPVVVGFIVAGAIETPFICVAVPTVPPALGDVHVTPSSVRWTLPPAPTA
jgi:hypothetical protein